MLRGLIIDWGGVLTAPMGTAFTAWAEQDRVEIEHLREILNEWARAVAPSADPGSAKPVDRQSPADLGGLWSPMHQVERGELSPGEYEQVLADALRHRGSVVPAAGLLDRMLAGVQELNPQMLQMLRTVRAQGIRTALLSNSWGDHYPDELFDNLFDAVVISGRVGSRKPEPVIYQRVLDDIGLPANECVMVDDIARNVHAAVALGMVGVVHTTVEQTLSELEVLLGVPLGG